MTAASWPPPPWFGTVVRDHAVPFQCIAMGLSGAKLPETVSKVFPTAHASVGEISTTPFRVWRTPLMALGVPGLGLGTIFQAEPFQCIVSVKLLLWVPFAAEKLPTAQMSFADRAEMAPSELLVSVMPAGTTGSGAGMMCQAEPSQCSISVRPVSLRPTAQAFPLPRLATPNRFDFDPPLTSGVGTMLQLLPSQCAVSGSVCANPGICLEPTAQTSFAAAAETAFSFSSDRKMSGVGAADHAVPFQCSASMVPPASSTGFW